MAATCLFAGGHDLEMVEILRLVSTRPDVAVIDHHLAWGARASHYYQELLTAQSRGETCLLVELLDDLPADFPRHNLVWIDHHGQRAGSDQPTSLEQVFQFLAFPEEEWTRDRALVAANDRGYIDAMLRIEATPDELRDIRQRDRAAQGITEAEEAEGRDACQRAQRYYDSRLVVVEIPHTRAACVTDALDARLGGAGFDNLLIFSPNQTMFFGSGRCIAALRQAQPASWSGGSLPERGFWGCGHALEKADCISALKDSIMTKPAGEIAVDVFHHILLWPMLMRGPEKIPTEESVQRFIDALKEANWLEPAKGERQDLKAGTDHLQVDKDYTYEEIVYFHPFVRDFLFGDGHTPINGRPLRRLKREDITSLTVRGVPTANGKDRTSDLTSTSEELTFRVERMELLLVRPGVAMLLVEVSNRIPHDQLSEEQRESETANRNANPLKDDPRRQLTLEQVLHLQNRLRRIYPPYFISGVHGECLTSVVWNRSGVPGQEAQKPSEERCTTRSPRSEFDEFVEAGAEPPVYSHWQALFGSGIQPLKTGNWEGKLAVQQLLDDRMPAMSFIAVDDPAEISQDDEDRLPAFDPPGLDYQPEFRETLRASFRHDRFRHWGTTHYCNGTNFVAVTNTGSFCDILLGHFRRHYTHLAVISHFQHSALIYFADELADVAKRLANRQDQTEFSDAEWAERVRKLHHRFLKFRSRSYFTEVSNQIQGKELFRLWQDHLHTEELFERVAASVAQTIEALDNNELKLLTRSQEWLARRQAQLAKLGAIFLPVAIALSLLSVLFTSDFLPKYFTRQDNTTGPLSLQNIWNTPHVLWILTIGVISAGGVLSWWLCRFWFYGEENRHKSG